MFKLLVISPEMQNIDQVNCFTDIWSHYLPKALQELGVQISYAHLFPDHAGAPSMVKYYEDLETDADHALALGLRYWTRHSLMCYDRVRSKVKGKVAQYYDGPIDSRPVWSLVCRNTGLAPCNFSIGWAADPTMLLPRQDHEALRIFVDHPHYEGKDFTADVLGQVGEFIDSNIWRGKFSEVQVRLQVDNGFEDWDGTTRVKPFNRRHVPFREACKEYSKAHIFLPTHGESLGLVVLESAMCGALVVSRQGFIYQDRLDTVDHVLYNKHIPWQHVLDRISPEYSRQVAMKNSWNAVARRVVEFYNG